MARPNWDWDTGEENDEFEAPKGGSEVYPSLDRRDALIDMPSTIPGFADDEGQDLELRGPSEARLAQHERAFNTRNAFRAGTGGVAFGLQSFDREGWGNPSWTYYPGEMPELDMRGEELAGIDDFDERGEKLQEIAGQSPEPLHPGYTAMFAPTAKFYTDARYRPWYDFTEAGGGWMPESPFDIIGGDTIVPERAILGNFDTGDGDDDDDDEETPEEKAARKARAAARKKDPPNSEQGILGPAQLAARRRRAG